MFKKLVSIKEVAADILLPDAEHPLTRYRLRESLELLGTTIPKGFITDGASTPRGLWGVYPPVDKYFLAAVLHDYWLTNNKGWAASNEQFKLALNSCGVSSTRRWAMHAGTVVYGFIRTKLTNDLP